MASTRFVAGGRLDEIDDVAERLVRMVHENVAGADGRPDAARLRELGDTGCGTNCGSRSCGKPGRP